MHFVKIDKKGWETYTGLLGTAPFENGVSTRELTDHEIKFIGASIRLVRLDNGKQIGPATTMANNRNVSAEVKAPLHSATAAEPAEPEPLKYDRDRLEEIASEGGIKAVREIAKEFDVKGVEISKMIEDILEAQTKEAE